MSRWATILAGGSGTRFWPLSTPRKPKQMLSLAGPEPLLLAACQRVAGLIPPDRILVVTAADLVEPTRRLLADLPPANILGEPRAASTAPALTWATVVASARDPDASLLSLHADWFVGDDLTFRAAATRALEIAERHDLLVTVGIVPDRPETGYGYIELGAPLEPGASRVNRFVEKPDTGQAQALIRGGALWNSGLFAWTARGFLRETEQVAPEIAPHLPRLLAGDVAGFFAAATPIAVDRSHFERSRRVAVVPGDFPWDDVGTWAALPRVRGRDAQGNTLVGDGVTLETTDTVIWADDGPVVAFGVRGLVVVRANGVTLVTTPEGASRLKTLLAALPTRLREVS